DLDLIVVDHLGDLADESTGGNDGIAAAQVFDQFLVFLRALLLRPQDQKIHDDEDQNERQQLHPHTVAAEHGARLGKTGRHEHLSVLCACALMCSLSARIAPAPPQSIGPTKSARTIAASGPIATLVCPENPADSTHEHGDLAGLPAPR